MLIQYIRSYPPYLEGASSVHNSTSRRAVMTATHITPLASEKDSGPWSSCPSEDISRSGHSIEAIEQEIWGKMTIKCRGIKAQNVAQELWIPTVRHIILYILFVSKFCSLWMPELWMPIRNKPMWKYRCIVGNVHTELQHFGFIIVDTSVCISNQRNTTYSL